MTDPPVLSSGCLGPSLLGSGKAGGSLENSQDKAICVPEMSLLSSGDVILFLFLCRLCVENGLNNWGK